MFCVQNMDNIIRTCLEKLGYEHIRPNQETVIKEYLQGKDVLFCSPTGSGKSLTFEIAPYVFRKFNNLEDMSACCVVVVSPLVALMQSQADNFHNKGLKSVYLHDKDSGINVEDLQEGKVDIIFASPESLLGDHRQLLINLSKKGALKTIFVDEAHCITKFGKGDKKKKTPAFRPKYGQLGELRSLVQRNIPVIALTATASKTTQDIIIKDLCMSKCTQIVVNPEKTNVKYSVETTKHDIEANFKWLFDLLNQTRTSCPRIIVFFRQIKQISEVFEYFQTNLDENQYVETETETENGYQNRMFAMFHLSTSDIIKRHVCSSFQTEDGHVRVVLCSTSFSMGLDVRNVNTVVHYGPANDLDDYLQETGRAGRDPTAACHAIILKYTRCLSSQKISTDMKTYVLLLLLCFQKAVCCRGVRKRLYVGKG